MTPEIFVKGAISAVFGCVFAWVVFSRFDSETGMEQQETDRQRYLPYIPGTLLPIYLLTLTLLCLPTYGLKRSMEMVLSMSFGIFLHISVFYAVLFFLIPVLRKYISSRACAMLWIIPNYLYITQQSTMEIPRPALVLHIPGKLLWIVLLFWIVGFILILFKSIWDHLMFRRIILKDSVPVTDPDILSVWNEEVIAARIKKPRYKVVVSPCVTTPLSIGFFQRTITVVLPEKEYTTSELEMIFRHEIIHICRGDGENKFFLVFCCAIFWFNPMMWIAKRKVSDDLELSCDETVLLDCDESQRKQYAALILNTAGDERGFTTCLSATASALQYRLKNIMRPVNRTSGALVVGITFFFLCMTIGYVALSYDEFTGQEIIFQNDVEYIDPRYTISAINTTIFDHNGFVECKDEDALEQYLAKLQFSRVLGNYSMSDYDERLLLIYESPHGDFGLHIRDQFMTVTPLGRTSLQQEHYYIQSNIDWEYISSLLYTGYIQDSTLAFPPQLDVLTNNGYYTCPGNVISYIVNGQKQDRQSWWYSGHRLGILDPGDTSVRLIFTHEISEEFFVSVSDIKGNIIREYSSMELINHEILPLEPEPTYYTIQVSFEDDSSQIIMEYEFSINFSDP